MKKCRFSYAPEADTLTIRYVDGDTQHSVNHQDVLIIDVDEHREVVGLEFLDVTEGLPEHVLETLSGAAMSVRYGDGIVYIRLLLTYEDASGTAEKDVYIPVGGGVLGRGRAAVAA